jgi:hypothetical protein
MDFPVSMFRDTLEYIEAKTLLAERAEVRRHLHNLNKALKQLRCLSSHAVDLAENDLREQRE